MIFLAKHQAAIPDLTSKLIDWTALAEAGGEDLIYGKRVLDLGPCYGLDAFMFAQKAKRTQHLRDPNDKRTPGTYTAVDRDPHVILWLRERVPECDVRQADLTALPFPDYSFDTVLDFSSLDNTQDPQKGYAEAVRVLAPGGTIVTTFANALHLEPSEGETPLFPTVVRAWLGGYGLTQRYASHWHYNRAALVMVRT